LEEAVGGEVVDEFDDGRPVVAGLHAREDLL
jgi:hypothetical protein